MLQRLRGFKAEARSRFPSIPDPALDVWPLREHDALAVYDFIEVRGRPCVALDIGTFIGLSAFSLALNPLVRRVVTVDPNPLLHAEINEKVDVVGTTVTAEGIEDVRVQDVARMLLAHDEDVAAKTTIVEGVVASPSPNTFEVVDISSLVDDADLIALVDGLHTPDGVQGDLSAIFGARPKAVAILDDCRHAWGPYVQAGVADFLSNAPGAYRFTLLADVSSSFAQSDLGFVYSTESADDVERSFNRLQQLYASFDPLALIAREEELQRIVIETRERLAQMQDTLSALENSLSWKLTRPLRVLRRAVR
jgi:BMFP domain-containing protein YqiC